MTHTTTTRPTTTRGARPGWPLQRPPVAAEAATPGVRSPSTAGGFTLVEILIAISIIVLMLALAMPAFRAITGSRSSEGATNQISAMLGRARTDAVGVQQPRGVAFYTDAAGQCRMAEVGPTQFTPFVLNAPYTRGTYVTAVGQGIAGGPSYTEYGVCIQDVPANTANTAFPTGTIATQPADTAYWHIFVDKAGNAMPPPNPASSTSATFVNSDLYFACLGIFYDVLPDTDPIALPLGVGVQVITNAAQPSGGGPRATDGYLRAGAVVFDATGRVAYLRPGFVFANDGAIGLAVNGVAGGFDVAFNNTNGLPNPPKPVGGSPPASYPVPQPLPTSYGLVVYDRDAFANQNFPTVDPTFVAAGSYGTVNGSPKSEADAEAWLDVNATPLLVNRYNGTLVRGE